MTKRNFNFKSISARFVTALVSVSILFLIVFESVAFFFLNQVFVNQKLSDVKLLIQSSNEYLKAYTSGLSRDVLGLVNIIEIFQDETSISSSLYAYQSEHSTLYLNTVAVNGNNNVFLDKPHLLGIANTDIYQELYRNTTSSAYRGVSYSQPYCSPLSLTDTIAICAPNASGNTVVICEIDLKKMLSSITSDDKDGYYWILFSSDNYPVAFSSKIKGSDKTHIFESITRNEPKVTVNNETCYVVSLDKGIIGLSIYTLVPESIIINATRQTKTIIGTIGALMVFVIVLVSGIVGNSISKPITKLSTKIKSAENLSQVNISEEKERDDEIGFLANSLSDLDSRINNLIKEIESIAEERRLLEIDALQAQIHPHFLGNTLACISALIKSDQKQEAYNSTILLTKLMRYSIGNTTPETTLESELEATECYLKLRLMRSPQLFSYSIIIPETHQNINVPKLILQPIVENAIKHGFCDKSEGYQISILTYTKDRHLYLSINNNGRIVDKNRLVEIQNNKIQPSIGSHGIGLRNVFRRLTLNQDSSTGGVISSTQDSGTTVILDLGLMHQNQQQ